MLKQIQKNQKLLDFQVDDEQNNEPNSNASSQQYRFTKLNIKAKEIQNLMSDSDESNINILSNHQINTKIGKTPVKRYRPLKRNSSCRINKVKDNQNQTKQYHNKSVTKFKNIFSEAQEINLNSSHILKVYQEQQTTIERSPIKSNYSLEKVKHSQIYRAPQILRLSSTPKNESNIRQKLDFNEKNFRKTSYIQKSINEVIQKKLLNSNQNQKNFEKNKKIRVRIQDVKDLNRFAHKKISDSYVVIASLKKNTSGFNMFWPEFYLSDQKTGVHILSAKKKAANTTSNYYISRNSEQIDVQNLDYIGKVRANFLGSCFNIFNQGANPENISKSTDKIRKLLATIIYQSEISAANPKSMKVYLLKSPFTYYDLEGTNKRQQQISLQQLYEIGKNKDKINLFKNRKPTYNKKQNKFVLNFGGRIKVGSTKNFILQDSNQRQVMMFGKVTEQQYIVHISSPLTTHIGMGIALAQLDNKIICD